VRIVKLDGKFAGKLFGLVAVGAKRHLVSKVKRRFNARTADVGDLDVLSASSFFLTGF
jgi:hypothetical protein